MTCNTDLGENRLSVTQREQMTAELKKIQDELNRLNSRAIEIKFELGNGET
jgi:hypothetical protein